MSNDQEKEKWARLRKIILNIIREKEEEPQEKKIIPVDSHVNQLTNFDKQINNEISEPVSIAQYSSKLSKKEILKNIPLVSLRKKKGKFLFKWFLAFFNFKKTDKKNFFYHLIWKKIKIIIIIFIFLIVGFLIIFGIGLYKFHWNNKQVIKITNIFPYPAMIIYNKEINSLKIIRYSEFQEDFQAIKLFFQKQKQIDLNFQILSDDSLKENILEMTIEDYFIFEAFQKNGISIKKEEIDNKIQDIINQVGSVENLKKIIKNLYNWDLEKFKNKAIKQMISQEKIEKLIAPKDLKNWIKEQYKKVKIYKLI
jgi:uncharacterized integral membrane protein